MLRILPLVPLPVLMLVLLVLESSSTLSVCVV
jgi:hypothetical protein